MSRQDKLLKRFLSRPDDFTYDELSKLLAGFGYKQAKLGKTGGSRTAFINDQTRHIIRLHRPHPCHTLKRYQLSDVEDALKSKGIIP